MGRTITSDFTVKKKKKSRKKYIFSQISFVGVANQSHFHTSSLGKVFHMTNQSVYQS